MTEDWRIGALATFSFFSSCSDPHRSKRPTVRHKSMHGKMRCLSPSFRRWAVPVERIVGCYRSPQGDGKFRLPASDSRSGRWKLLEWSCARPPASRRPSMSKLESCKVSCLLSASSNYIARPRILKANLSGYAMSWGPTKRRTLRLSQAAWCFACGSTRRYFLLLTVTGTLQKLRKHFGWNKVVGCSVTKVGYISMFILQHQSRRLSPSLSLSLCLERR